MPPHSLLEILKQHGGRLRKDFGFVRLAVFGSVARGDAAPASDIDILVEFAGPADFRTFMGLRERLKELLGRPVDLVTTKALRPELRDQIEGEALRVA
jgi:predicted nucleotidyltransferase